MNNLLVAPVALPLLAGILLVLLRGRPRTVRTVAALATLTVYGIAFRIAGLVAKDGIQVLEVGSWAPPFGICFVADGFSAAMLLVSMTVSTAVLFFSFHAVDEARQDHFFFAFFQFLLMGINGSFLTGDVFNLFVWFEVLLIASYVLLALGGEGYQLQETFKYLVLNALASAFFLVAVAATYSIAGTVNLADLAVRWREIDQPALQNAIAFTFLFVFGIKGAIFPLYFWLPRSYYAPPTAVSALFGGLLTKVGVYAIFRVFTLVFLHDTAFTHGLLVWIAGLTMIFGVLGAISQNDVKRILSFHIVSQIGYMIMGIGLYTPLALAGGVFYIVHHIVVKTGLFLVGGAVERIGGTSHLKRLGGIGNTTPMLAALFLVVALSLAGLPPFSGFFSKLVLVTAGLEIGSFGIVATSLAVSFLTLFSMMKIFRNVFWGEAVPAVVPAGATRGLLAPIAFLCAITVVLGFAGELAFEAARGIAASLLTPADYVTAVLHARGEG